MIEHRRILRLNSQSYPVTPDERSLYFAVSAQLLEMEELPAPGDPAEQADAAVTVSAKLRAETIARLTRCRAIARYGAGVDNVDLDAATQRGIVVMNYPGFCVIDMAEHTMALLLTASRKILTMDACTRRGWWDARVRIPVHRLAGRTLGLLGFGRIGQETAHRAVAFGLKVIFHDTAITSPLPDSPAAPVSFDELVTASDFLSLHLPLTERTRHIIAEPQLKAMKRSAILINTARGALVDEEALVHALSERWIAGAALDVYEGLNLFSLPERVPDHPLFSMPDTVLTPHCGGCSVESLDELMREGARQLADYLSGDRPRNVVNPEVLPRLAAADGSRGA